jgi:hypothetical protein
MVFGSVRLPGCHRESPVWRDTLDGPEKGLFKARGRSRGESDIEEVDSQVGLARVVHSDGIGPGGGELAALTQVLEDADDAVLGLFFGVIALRANVDTERIGGAEDLVNAPRSG